MTCKRCSQDPGPHQTENWYIDARQCGFDDAGRFRTDNWRCATLLALRDLIDAAAHGYEHWSEDQRCHVLPIRNTPTFLIVSVYKHRGRTEGAWVLDQTEMVPLTLEAAETILEIRHEMGAGS